MGSAEKFESPEIIVDKIVEQLAPHIVMATPLGAGKPNILINCLYLRVKNNPELKLTILSALTLEKPKGKSELEKKFLGPFADRVFADYPDLLFELDRTQNNLPANIDVIEFYYPPGKFSRNSKAQQNYLSSNYTHVTRDVLNRGANLIFQQVSRGEIEGSEVYSLSCNPDTSIDLAHELKRREIKSLVVGQVNQNLPFMYGEAVVGSEFFDFLLDNREYDFKVFGPPKMSVSDVDYMIGVHASTLIKDDGELQIGIGSLGDALVYSLGLRQDKNESYREMLGLLEINEDIFPCIKTDGELGTFSKGLFAATEMFVDSFAELYKMKILKKRVFDSSVIQRCLNEGTIQEEFQDDILEVLLDKRAISSKLTARDVAFLKDFGIFKPIIALDQGALRIADQEPIGNDLSNAENLEQIKKTCLGTKLRNGAVAHAGFFLGPTSFYQFLKDLPVKERKLIRMKRISQINHLYGHEEIDRLQRKNGRFINTCMKVSLNGQASSDALENGTQISGVGGQYNFVAMAHELADGRSILQLRSTRTNSSGELESNIVFNYGNCTIPRHLRDIVITEYGIADLRSKTDSEVAEALISIADSRFQNRLIEEAIQANKLPENFKLSSRYGNNYPDRYLSGLKTLKEKGLFPAFPFGHEFTPEELKIGKALKLLKGLTKDKVKLGAFILKSMKESNNNPKFHPLLKRMKLEKAHGIKEKLLQKLLLRALAETS